MILTMFVVMILPVIQFEGTHLAYAKHGYESPSGIGPGCNDVADCNNAAGRDNLPGGDNSPGTGPTVGAQ